MAKRETAIAERTLPHNLPAERAVLGAILIHNDAFELASKLLTPSMFYRNVHRTIFESMVRLLDQARGCADMTLLSEDLERHGMLEDVGGPVYLAALVDGMPRRANVTAYAEVVREKAMLRDVIYASNKLLTQAYEEDTTAEAMLLAADKALVELQRGTANGHMKSLRETAPAVFSRMEYREQHRGEILGLTTGFQSVDDLTLGWQRADLIVIAARPSIGKTTFVMNSVTAACRAALAKEAPIRGAVFSMEMRREQLEDRILSSLSGIPLTRLQTGCIMGDGEWASLSQAIGTMSDCAIHIDDTPGQTVPKIRSACRRLKAEEGRLDFLVIDYVQLMASSLDRRGATRTEELTDISLRLRGLASELAVPVLVLSQLSRAGASRPDPRPILSDLRECGAFEQDADVVAFLHRKHHRQGGVTNLILEKQRMGPGGTLNLTLDRDTVSFTDGGEEPPAAEPTEAEKAERQRRVIIGRRMRRR